MDGGRFDSRVPQSRHVRFRVGSVEARQLATNMKPQKMKSVLVLDAELQLRALGKLSLILVWLTALQNETLEAMCFFSIYINVTMLK